MSDMTSNASRNFRSRAHSIALLTTNSEEYYVGSAVGLNVNTGRAVALSSSGTEHVRFVGWSQERVNGDGTKTVSVRVDGPVVESVSITGASAVTDVGKQVYMIDDQTFTLSRPAADAVAIGIVSRYRSGTTCDVLCFSIGEAIAFDAARPKEAVAVGTVGLKEALANDVVARKVLYGHGRIVNFHAYTAQRLPSGAAGSAIFELLLGATSLGKINLDAASGASGIRAFSAATSTDAIDARFSDGDVVTVKLSTLTAAFDGEGAATFLIDVLPA